MLLWFFPPDHRPYGDPHNTVTNAIAGGLGLLALLAIARSTMIGVWMSDRELLVRSWFVTRRYPRSSLRARAVSYSGFWNRWSDSSFLWTLGFSSVGSRVWSARGTIAWHVTTKRQLQQIQEWVSGSHAEQ